MFFLAPLQGCFVASPQKREKEILQQEQSKIRSSVAAEKRQQAQRSLLQPSVQKQESIDQTIAQYESFVAMPGPLTASKLSAMRRLGDLYMDSENNRFSIAMENYEKAIAKPNTQITPPIKNFSKSIALYEKILRAAPKYTERDQVYYHLASCYDQIGDREKSVSWLKKLTTEFSNSEFSQEVYFRLGEFNFDRNDLPQALAYYQKGATLKTSPLYYVNTLYKQGWTYYLLEDFSAAVDSFRQILDFNMDQGGRFTPSALGKPKSNAAEPLRQDLIGDTLQMVSRSFTELNQATSVAEYFKTIGDRPYVPEIYYGMAVYIAQQDRFPEALKIFDLFLSLYPRHERVLDVYESTIKIYVETKNFEKASSTREKLVTFLAPSQSWYGSNVNPVVRKRSQEFRLTSIEELALFNNHQAQQLKDGSSVARDAIFKKAVYWYRLYLQEAEVIQFKNTKKIEDTRYLLGECLFESKNYESAGEVYLKVSLAHPEVEKKIKSAQDAFIAFEKDFYEKVARKEKVETTLKLLSSSRKNFQRLMAENKAPKNELALTSFLEREGNAFFKVDQIAESRPALEELVKDYPASPEAFRGTKILALGYFRQEQYQKSEALFAEALEQLPRQNNLPVSEEQDLHELRASSIFKMAEEYQKSGDSEKAAATFIRVQATEPKSVLVDKSLYQAGQQYLKLKSVDKAFSVFRKLAKEYPKSEFGFAGLWESAQNFKSAKQWVMAGTAFSEAATIARKNSERQSALMEAALAFEETQQFEKGIPVWLMLLEQQPTPGAAQKVEYAYRLGNAYEKSNQEQLAHRYFDQARKTFEQLQTDVAKRRAKEADVQNASFFAAKTYLALGVKDEKRLVAIKLVPPFEKNLKVKQQLLDATLKSYAKVIEFKDAEMVTEVGYRIGFVLEDFAKNLKDSPAPDSLSKDEREQYRYLLEEKAFPFEEKAIAAYEGNLNRARENNLYNGWVKKSYENLAILVPARYAKTEKMPEVLSVQEMF